MRLMHPNQVPPKFGECIQVPVDFPLPPHCLLQLRAWITSGFVQLLHMNIKSPKRLRGMEDD